MSITKINVRERRYDRLDMSGVKQGEVKADDGYGVQSFACWSMKQHGLARRGVE